MASRLFGTKISISSERIKNSTTKGELGGRALRQATYVLARLRYLLRN